MSQPAYRIDFPALMRLCEDNYLMLSGLLPALEEQDELRLVLPAGDDERSVTFRVLERCPYTTELSLEIASLHRLLPPASLTVRLYHDARIAEVVRVHSSRRVPARQPYPNPGMHQRDEKHQWNLHLSEWLRHLREHGLAGAGALRAVFAGGR